MPFGFRFPGSGFQISNLGYLKSEISLGSNFNNRTEEALGSATDIVVT